MVDENNAGKQKAKKDTYLPLILLGVLLLTLGLTDWSWWTTPGSTTVTKTTSPNTTTETSETVSSPNVSPGGQTRTTSDKATTATGTREVLITESISQPSETLRTTVLGLGVLLVLVGAFYGRIKTIKGPGGIELSLEANAEIASVVAQNLSDPKKAKIAVLATHKRIESLGYEPKMDEVARIAEDVAGALTSSGDEPDSSRHTPSTGK